MSDWYDIARGFFYFILFTANSGNCYLFDRFMGWLWKERVLVKNWSLHWLIRIPWQCSRSTFWFETFLCSRKYLILKVIDRQPTIVQQSSQHKAPQVKNKDEKIHGLNFSPQRYACWNEPALIKYQATVLSHSPALSCLANHKIAMR
jgi:hypothetical protein